MRQRSRLILALACGALLACGLCLPVSAQIPGWQDTTFKAADQGSATVDGNGVWTIRGAGWDTWDRRDEFHIVYKPLKGDGSVTTKLLSAEDANEWAKTGVMMRNDLENNAASVIELQMSGTGHGGEMVFRGVSDPQNGDTEWGATRMAKDEKTLDGGHNLFPREYPVWLKLERRGNKFTGFASKDGAAWIPVTRSMRIDMKEEIVAGTFVCSHEEGTIIQATFDGKVTDVSNKLLTPEEATPLQPDPVVALGGDNSVMLMWERVNHLGKEADGYIVEKAPIGGDFAKIAELPGDKTSYVDDTIKNGESARYRVLTTVKVGPAGDKVLQSTRFTQRFIEVTGAPNPIVKIGDRDYFSSILDGGSPNAYTEIPGSAAVDGSGVVTLTASGWDIQDKSDGGQQLLTPVSGDFTFTARVLGAPTVEGGDVNEWAKFGIAVKESTQAESMYIGMFVTPLHGIRAPHRRLFLLGHSDDRGPNEDEPAYPLFLRIQRRGNEVKLMTSADGATFAEYGDPATSVVPGLPQNLHVGFMGTSHDVEQIAQAKFDRVTLTTP